ncbi:phosphate ABC transporter permease PstA [candidate division GN15 bacterium]|nr:phosphate ABC transporter permease PstA [candidate division GN15 bacterium]
MQASPESRRVGWLPRGLTFLAVGIILTMLAVIFGNIFFGGLRTISIEFLTAFPEQGMMAGGIFPAIFGTAALVILMTVAVLPLGVLTAIYLHEYARPDAVTTRWIRQAIYNLAGVPSIVFGLFGLGFFVSFVGGGIDAILHPDAGPVWGQPAIIWASLTMAVLTLPVVIVSTEEAMRTVPRAMREGSFALGAGRMQTMRHIVLPQAMPGILTGAILAVSRGAGEVAPIMFTGVAYYQAHLPTGLTDQFMELGYHIYVLATQSPDVEQSLPLLYGTVLVLLALTFVLNLTAVSIRSKLRRRQRLLPY